MDAATFTKQLDQIDNLPTLPVVAIELNRLLQNEDVPVKEVSGLIEKDPAIVPRILKLVNSAFFGLKSQITNLSHAVVILGFSTVRNAVVSVSVIDAFRGRTVLEDFDMTDFWTHAIAVAVTARYIAVKNRSVSGEDAFTAGLLHDTGKIVLGQFFQDSFKQVWVSAKENGLSFNDAERKLLPATHAEIGGYLAEKWQFPPSLSDAIRWHHEIRETASDPDLLVTLHTADAIVNHFGRGSIQEVPAMDLSQELLKSVEPIVLSAPAWFPEVAEEIQDASRFFLKEL